MFPFEFVVRSFTPRCLRINAAPPVTPPALVQHVKQRLGVTDRAAFAWLLIAAGLKHTSIRCENSKKFEVNRAVAHVLLVQGNRT